jgi:hypothetical protein
MSEPTTDKINELDKPVAVKSKVTLQEKENFFKAFLADKPFISEEFLFDKKLQVKFSTLSIKENNTVMLQMQFDREQNIAKVDDKYLMQVMQYRLAASLVELDHKPFAQDITESTFPSNKVEGTTYLMKRLELMNTWPLFKIASLSEAFARFEKKIKELTEESFKENF